MRKWMKLLLLAGVFAVLLCGSALAADSGIGSVGLGDYSAQMQTADETPVSMAGGDQVPAGMSNFYPGAVRIALTCTHTSMKNGEECLIYVVDDSATYPTDGNLVYIDQAAISGSSASFNIYPSKLEGGKTYSVYFTTTSAGPTPYGTFRYYASYVLGDVDNDGQIRTSDALAVLRHQAGRVTLTGDSFSAADVTRDGQIRTDDALMILRYQAGRITSFN